MNAKISKEAVGFCFISLLAMVSRGAVEITASTAAGTALDGVYEVNENVTLSGGTGMSGLSVAAGKTAAIYIKNNVTLTLNGGRGSGATAAGAGLQVPVSSTLILVGGGKLKATGGKSGDGCKGENGGDGYRKDSVSHAGQGGRGGKGAGGAGAGIGGKGGTGGAAGEPKDGIAMNDYYPEYSGLTGNAGSRGGDGESMGSLYVLGSVSVTAAAGEQSTTTGAGGEEGTSYDTGYLSSKTTHHGLGGGGGGGGGGVSTNEASSVGGGSGGGGGGGGGGTGAIDWSYSGSSPQGAHGQGGFGGVGDGEQGQPFDREQASGKGSRWGGYGGNGGDCGKKGDDGSVYISDSADVPDVGKPTGYQETHEFLKRTIKLDFDGGTSQSKSSDTCSAYLYLTMPDVPIPDRDGHLFMGYYTGKNGTGTRYYDGTGDPQVDFWNRDETSCTLYAYWKEASPPENALVVTRLDDEDFNSGSKSITFRAAVTWAMLYPNLAGADGTLSKITFASDLWEGRDGEPIYVTLSAGEIRVGEKRFTDSHPLIIEGPDRTACPVILNAKSMTERILDVGQGNTVAISNLTFKGARASESGAAIKMKGGALRLENCEFISNTAEASGGAVYGGECEWMKVVNCRFEGNAANSKTQGGGAIRGGKKLTIVNTSFWDNEAAYGGAVYAAATTMMVNSSLFKNSAWQTGAGLYSGGSNDQISVINCTVNANMANCQENDSAHYDGGGGLYAVGGSGSKVLLVNDFFVGNRLESLAYRDVEFGTNLTLDVKTSMFGKADSRIKENYGYNVRLDKNERDFFEVGERELYYRQTTKCGVTHDYLQTEDPSGDIGYYVYHDADWDNVALAATKTGGKAAVLGSASEATILLQNDISPRDLTRYRSQCGSFWFIHDHPEYGTVVTKIEDESDYYDGALTLREIIEGIATEESLWVTNRKDGVYTVTFDSSLKGQTIQMQAAQLDVYGLTNDVNIVVDGGDNEITIDGDSGHVDGSLPRVYRGFRVQRGATLTLKNLKFVNCVGTPLGTPPMPGYDGGALLNHGTTTVENCTFTACAAGPRSDNSAGFGGAICNGAAGTNGCLLTVTNSKFLNCIAAEGGAIYNYGSNTVILSDCEFTGNQAYPGSASVYTALGGAICTVASGDLGCTGCTFSGNTMKVDGEVVASDVQAKHESANGAVVSVTAVPVKAQSYYTTHFARGALSVALNERALPESGEMTLSTATDAKMPDGVTPAVTMRPAGLKPGLSYALGYTYDLEKTFSTEESPWVKTDESGNLNEPLRAPAAKDRGFYKVFVRE